MAGNSDDSLMKLALKYLNNVVLEFLTVTWITIEHSSVCNSPPRFYIIFTKSGFGDSN